MSAPTGTRRLARYRDVGAAEVALISEANLERDVGERSARLDEQFLSHRGPLGNDVLMRRVASALLERAVEVSQGQLGDARENFGPEVFGQVLVDMLAHAAQGAGCESAERFGPNGHRLGRWDVACIR